jgi:hypothetical protein
MGGEVILHAQPARFVCSMENHECDIRSRPAPRPGMLHVDSLLEIALAEWQAAAMARLPPSRLARGVTVWQKE